MQEKACSSRFHEHTGASRALAVMSRAHPRASPWKRNRRGLVPGRRLRPLPAAPPTPNRGPGVPEPAPAPPTTDGDSPKGRDGVLARGPRLAVAGTHATAKRRTPSGQDSLAGPFLEAKPSKK